MKVKDTITIRSVSQFVESICQNHSDKNVYRGLQDANFKLIPSIARYSHLINDPATNWHTFYEELQRKFRTEFELFSKKEISNRIELSAIAQHHGMITNLLDWTQNPLVALYFSICNIKHYENVDQTDSVVWALSHFEPIYLGPGDKIPNTDKETVIFPRHLSERFKVQKGCFTYHQFPDGMKPFVPMEEVDNSSMLLKYVIPNQEKKGIRHQLHSVGINEGSVFPDLEGMCRQLTWKCTNTNYTQRIGF
ncbi:MAG: hypothetical protein JWO30_4253 [Fibrobacteres bacterium]|nr:hypothetical protein [Fibrobacterota bacterium]